MDYNQVIELRKNNNHEFINFLYKHFSFREMFNGEYSFKVTKEENGKTHIAEKFIFLTPAEKEEMISIHKSLFEQNKNKVLKEADERYELAKKLNLHVDSYKDPEICMIVRMAFLDEPIEEREFKNACFAIQKNKEIKGMVWKSYLFKGFLYKEQIQSLLNYLNKKKSE